MVDWKVNPIPCSTLNMNRGLGQWCAYAEAGKDLEDQRKRISEVPQEMRAEVIEHVRGVNKLKADERMRFLFGGKME